MIQESVQWWGYIHVNGGIHLKRYFDNRDIQDAEESPFCELVFGPFKAENYDAALKYVEDNIDNVEKKKEEIQ